MEMTVCEHGPEVFHLLEKVISSCWYWNSTHDWDGLVHFIPLTNIRGLGFQNCMAERKFQKQKRPDLLRAEKHLCLVNDDKGGLLEFTFLQFS